MNKKTIGLALLLFAVTGCGKYAAADPLGHGFDMKHEEHPPSTMERNAYREECQWKRPLFC